MTQTKHSTGSEAALGIGMDKGFHNFLFGERTHRCGWVGTGMLWEWTYEELACDGDDDASRLSGWLAVHGRHVARARLERQRGQLLNDVRCTL